METRTSKAERIGIERSCKLFYRDMQNKNEYMMWRFQHEKHLIDVYENFHCTLTHRVRVAGMHVLYVSIQIDIIEFPCDVKEEWGRKAIDKMIR